MRFLPCFAFWHRKKGSQLLKFSEDFSLILNTNSSYQIVGNFTGNPVYSMSFFFKILDSSSFNFTSFSRSLILCLVFRFRKKLEFFYILTRFDVLTKRNKNMKIKQLLKISF